MKSTIQSARAVLPKLPDRLPLGDQGLMVSPFCLGRVQSPETVPAAFDAGINFFFVTADMHWPLYEASRRGLEMLLRRRGSIREQVVVAGVAYPTQPEFCTAPFQELVEATSGLDHLDVLLAGGAYRGEFLTRLPVYQANRRRGFLGCRAIGASFHDRQAALLAVNHRLVDIAFVRYNPVHRGAGIDLFPQLMPRPRPLLFNFTNTHGYVSQAHFRELGLDQNDYWQPEITDHYRFALTRPDLDGLLISLAVPEQVEALARALEQGPLDELEEKHLVDLALVDKGAAKAVSWVEK